MLEQVVNELVQEVIAQTFADNSLKEIPPQHFKQTSAPVIPPAIRAAGALVLELLKLFQRLSHFAYA